MENIKSKKIIIIVGVVIILLVVIAIIINSSNKATEQAPVNPNEPAAQTSNENAVAGEDYAVAGTATPAQPVVDTEKVYDLTNAKAVVPGASMVTPDQKVVTPEGKIAQNDAIPNSENAPKPVIVSKEELPKEVINLEINNGTIKPNTFSVKAGAPVSLAVSSADSQVHVFIFSNAVVGAIAMGVGPGETKAITFNAPGVGEYAFHCDVPGHKGQGESGKMIVK